jgi:hypothetical protein
LNIQLCIAIESQWRGQILDTVRPIAKLQLQEDPELVGLFTIGSLFILKLSNGSVAEVWCARTATSRFVIDIKYMHQPIVHLEAGAPISSLLRLPDAKIYEFNIKIEA